jgi:hypothetical protein
LRRFDEGFYKSDGVGAVSNGGKVREARWVVAGLEMGGKAALVVEGDGRRGVGRRGRSVAVRFDGPGRDQL